MLHAPLRSPKARISLGTPSAKPKSIPIPTARYNTVRYCIFCHPEARVCLSPFGLLSQQPTSSECPEMSDKRRIRETKYLEKDPRDSDRRWRICNLSSCRKGEWNREMGCSLPNRQRACIWAVIRAKSHFGVRLSGSHGPCFCLLFFLTPLILVDFYVCIDLLLFFDRTPNFVEPLGTLRCFDRSTRSVPTRPDPRRFCFF